MKRAVVESSVLASVGHDADTRTLEVEFRTRKLYRYFDVPTGTYEELMRAPSKGQFFNAKIRNAFRFSRV